MRIPPRALGAPALLLAALALSACGGPEETTQSSNEPNASTPPAATIQYGDHDESIPAVPERRSKTEPKRHNADEDGASKEARNERKQNGTQRSETGGRNGKDKSSAASGKPSACPKASSREQCAEAAQAIEKSSGSRPVPPDTCPAAVDAATCEEAGKIYAEAEDSGRPVQSGECPRAMTEEQCRQAGEAYAEATK